MKLSSDLWRALNIFARVFGLIFTGAGLYFAARGFYLILQPEMASSGDTLGFAPWFRPFVVAFILLVVGVHFVRGAAYRPDLLQKTLAGESPPVLAQSWWTGDPLEKQSSRELDT